MRVNCTERRGDLEVITEVNRMFDALDEIVKLAKPRLVMGGIRYCSDWEHEALMKYMQQKLSEYISGGNSELLVDLVNFCAIEYALKTHKSFHFKAKDR